MYVKMIRNISDQDAGDFVSCVYWGYGTAGLGGGGVSSKTSSSPCCLFFDKRM